MDFFSRFCPCLNNDSSLHNSEFDALDSHLDELHDIWKQGNKDEFDQLLLKCAESDNSVKVYFESLGDDIAQALSDVRHGNVVQGIEETIHAAEWKSEPHPEVREATGEPVQYYSNRIFQNWGRTVENKPKAIFTPKTKGGICNIVKWASKKNLKVRASGYKHSWADIFSEDGHVLIAMLSFQTTNHMPAFHLPMDPTSELEDIQLLDEIVENGVTKCLCKVASGTTNEHFRSWVIENSKPEKGSKIWGDWWTIPVNTVLVEISFGGSNAPICHGSGHKHMTLCDLVQAVELVNPNGELQVIDDPRQISAAAGCFGLLGVVTALTLKLDALTFAKLQPYTERVGLGIPPPKGLKIPKGINMSGITQSDRDKAFQTFVELCEKSYYNEFFWFPLHKDVWINCWKNDGDRSKAVDYPSKWDTNMQNFGTMALHGVNSTVFQALPPKWQAEFLGKMAMKSLPHEPGETIVTPLIDGLHFVRGIQNVRVRDMEWEIPIPGLKHDPSIPDWSICQHAWWAVISAVYHRYNADDKDIPMRMTLEMRITGGSNIVMAPQYGNIHGTCSIEILTPNNVDQSEFQAFMQEITDLWAEYRNVDGAYLNIRPHWAKQWQGLTVRGKPIIEYLKNDAFANQIQIFRSHLSEIAAQADIDLHKYKIFSNPLLEEIINPWQKTLK